MNTKGFIRTNSSLQGAANSKSEIKAYQIERIHWNDTFSAPWREGRDIVCDHCREGGRDKPPFHMVPVDSIPAPQLMAQVPVIIPTENTMQLVLL